MLALVLSGGKILDMITIIVSFFGLILGGTIAKSLGDSKEANAVKIILVILLILFALWNEGALAN